MFGLFTQAKVVRLMGPDWPCCFIVIASLFSFDVCGLCSAVGLSGVKDEQRHVLVWLIATTAIG